MNTAVLDSSSTGSATADSSTEISRSTATAPSPPAPSNTAPQPTRDESVVRLVHAQKPPPTTTHSAAPVAQEQPAPLPIAVLTNDPGFADQLRCALEGERAFATVASIDAAATLAADGRCSILVTDVAAARNALDALTRTLRAHDPALVIVIAGNRDQGSTLIGLQSAGVVDGFLLKPVTAAATQLVIEAASRRYRSARATLRTHRGSERSAVVADDIDCGDTIEVLSKPRPPSEAIAPTRCATPDRSRRLRPSWGIVAVVAIVVAAAVWFGMTLRSGGVDPEAIVAKHLASAAAAFDAGHLLDARDGAAHHYQAVLAIDPDNLPAQRGMEAVARELSKQTQAHMAQRRFAEAAIALARLHEVQPDYAELPLLNSQLNALQDTLVASHVQQGPDASTAAMGAPVAAERATEPPIARTKAPAAPEREAEHPRGRTTVESASRMATLAGVASDREPLAAAPTNTAAPAPAIDSTVSPAFTRQSAAAVDHGEVLAAARTAEMRRPEQPSSLASEVLTASIVRPTVRSPPGEMPKAPAPALDESQMSSASASDPPSLVKYVPPRYPSDAHARQMEGWVEISMEIAPNGDVLAPRIESGEKRQLFGRAALTAVRQWKYAPDPAREAGKRSSVKVEFKLQ